MVYIQRLRTNTTATIIIITTPAAAAVEEKSGTFEIIVTFLFF